MVYEYCAHTILRILKLIEWSRRWILQVNSVDNTIDNVEVQNVAEGGVVVIRGVTWGTRLLHHPMGYGKLNLNSISCLSVR